MHIEGEVDLRATYIVVVVASLLDLMREELMEGVREYLASCQTYEGGLGSDPHREAHGGYTYCGVSALVLLDSLHLLDLPALLYWLANK